MKKIISLILGFCILFSTAFASVVISDSNGVQLADGYHISLNRYMEEGLQHGKLTCTLNGKTIWEFNATPNHAILDDGVSECYVNGGTAYIVDRDGLKAIDIPTGRHLWTADSAGTTDIEFDSYGNIYNCGFDGHNLHIISKTGKLLYKIVAEYTRVFDLKVDGNTLYIYAEEGPYFNEEENCAIIPFDISIFANAEIEGYNDVLPKMNQNEKQALFNDFLCAFSGYDIDYRTASDYTLLEEILPTARIEGGEALELEINYTDSSYGKVSKQALDKLTTSIYGRVFDGNDFKYENMPPADQIGDGYFFWKDGEWFYQYGGDRGVGGGEGYPKHLYDIGNGYYYAVQEVVWFNSGGDEYDRGMCAYIIKKNNDGSYRLIRTYAKGVILNKADIDAFVNPSDWAKAEIDAANSAGLIPNLDDEPLWNNNATRLQFAQLAVSLAETITGKQLPQNKSVAFKDCNDAAVLKAYQAGIVNGVSDTEFAPNESLTREQLATMIWRTVKYIQKETNKEKLTDGGDISGFADAGDVSDYASEAVAALAKYDIMKGTSETELSPKSACTVEQSVLLIYRTFNKIK